MTAINMIYASPETLRRLGAFAEFLNSVSPNVLIIVSPSDTFGDTPEGQSMLAKQIAYNKGGKTETTKEDSLEIARFALQNLTSAIHGIHPKLINIFSDQKKIETIKRSVSDEPAAMPFLGQDNTPTAGLIILGQRHDNVTKILAKLGMVNDSEIFPIDQASAAQVEQIAILHEAFHLRRGRNWVDQDN